MPTHDSFRFIHVGRSDHGAVAIEYALLACFLGLGLVAALKDSKASLKQDLNLVTASIGKVSASIASPRSIVSQTTNAPYFVGSTQYYTEITVYDDRSRTTVRRQVNNPSAGYQMWEYDPTGFSPLTLTVTADGRSIYERSTGIAPGVAFVEVSDGPKAYAMLQTVTDDGTTTTVDRVVTDPGTYPWVFKQYQAVYVQDAARNQTTVGTRTVAQDGTVTSTGQSIASYF